MLAVPFGLVVIAALIVGVVGVVSLKLYGFVLLVAGLATIRPAVALVQAARTGRSPAWFEEQDLNDDELKELRGKYQ